MGGADSGVSATIPTSFWKARFLIRLSCGAPPVCLGCSAIPATASSGGRPRDGRLRIRAGRRVIVQVAGGVAGDVVLEAGTHWSRTEISLRHQRVPELAGRGTFRSGNRRITCQDRLGKILWWSGLCLVGSRLPPRACPRGGSDRGDCARHRDRQDPLEHRRDFCPFIRAGRRSLLCHVAAPPAGGYGILGGPHEHAGLRGRCGLVRGLR